ncbi:RING/U-box superfamily protein [Melia azedarach]|uniref:RING/U-box superfamily protein n=1 Tax=Melia azedarach TaxID=155640 RepID=A0ACC1XFV7_MELAZ|nr:RING/U-box superfamily protein [Melia azedarach]
MAGMLPGVECARRRRFHQSGGYSDSQTISAHSGTRRSSFCLYTSNHESHHTSISSLRSIIYQASQDEKLGGIAREAKERLDERLRAQRKSETKRQNGKESSKKCMVPGELHTQVFGSKKSGSLKRFSWAKLGWKACEQEECAICLDRFKIGETLLHLPCAHRFHARCLVPWLENNAHCPCCRMEILLVAPA